MRLQRPQKTLDINKENLTLFFWTYALCKYKRLKIEPDTSTSTNTKNLKEVHQRNLENQAKVQLTVLVPTKRPQIVPHGETDRCVGIHNPHPARSSRYRSSHCNTKNLKEDLILQRTWKKYIYHYKELEISTSTTKKNLKEVHLILQRTWKKYIYHYIQRAWKKYIFYYTEPETTYCYKEFERSTPINAKNLKEVHLPLHRTWNKNIYQLPLDKPWNKYIYHYKEPEISTSTSYHYINPEITISTTTNNLEKVHLPLHTTWMKYIYH